MKLGERKEWQLQSVCEGKEDARQTGAQESEMCGHATKMFQEILAALFRLESEAFVRRDHTVVCVSRTSRLCRCEGQMFNQCEVS